MNFGPEAFININNGVYVITEFTSNDFSNDNIIVIGVTKNLATAKRLSTPNRTIHGPIPFLDYTPITHNTQQNPDIFINPFNSINPNNSPNLFKQPNPFNKFNSANPITPNISNNPFNSPNSFTSNDYF